MAGVGALRVQLNLTWMSIFARRSLPWTWPVIQNYGMGVVAWVGDHPAHARVRAPQLLLSGGAGGGRRCTSCWPCIFALLHVALWQTLVQSSRPFWAPGYFETMLWTVMLYAVLLALSSYHEFADWLAGKTATALLRAKIAEAELTSSAMRFDPENVLARLDVLADIVLRDAAMAERALTQLAHRLRTSLDTATRRRARSRRSPRGRRHDVAPRRRTETVTVLGGGRRAAGAPPAAPAAARRVRRGGGGRVKGGRSAVEQILARNPDLVFLDIQMPDLDGFGVIAEVGPERMPSVVFVTAFDQYALRAFEVHALDYLLEPFEADRFHNRARARPRPPLAGARRGLSGRGPAAPPALRSAAAAGRGGGGGRDAESASRSTSPFFERVAVKTDGATRILQIADVDWFETDGNYVRVHVGKATYLIRSRRTACRKSSPRAVSRGSTGGSSSTWIAWWGWSPGSAATRSWSCATAASCASRGITGKGSSR